MAGNMDMRFKLKHVGKGISLEVHLLNWQGDLYGQRLQVKLVKFIRDEKKFNQLNL